MVPIVSVLCCVYNGEKYIVDAVESVLDNGFEAFELILVDDGSNDKSAEIIRFYASKDRRIRAFFKPNTGLTDSLNFALKHVRGEFIARLDVDDLMLKGRIKKQLDYLNTHETISLLGSDAQLIDAGGAVIGHTSLGNLSHEDCLARLMNMDAFFAHSSWMIRQKSMQQLAGYDSFFRKTQDYDLMLRLSRIGNIASLGEPLIALRKQEGSISYDSSFLQYKYALTALALYYMQDKALPLPTRQEKLFQLIEAWVTDSSFDRLMLGQRHLSFAKYDLLNWHVASLWRHLRLGWQADPFFMFHRSKHAAIRRHAINHLLDYVRDKNGKTSD